MKALGWIVLGLGIGLAGCDEEREREEAEVTEEVAEPEAAAAETAAPETAAPEVPVESAAPAGSAEPSGG